MFYVSSDEADSEGNLDPSAHVSASTSFSDSFTEHQKRAIDNATIADNLKRNPETHTLSQTTGSGLEDSIWANPRGSPYVNSGFTTDISHHMKMTSCENHPKAPRPPSRFLGLWVQYKPGATTQNLHRKVVISGLKSSCSLSEILDQVYDGLIVEAILVNTINITGTKSAIISFFEERSAVAYTDYVSNHLCEIEGKKITARLISTPSWPLSLALKQAIRGKNHTRCLEIQNFPRNISSIMLRDDLEIEHATTLDTIEHMEIASNSTARLRFGSVRAAQQASDHLSSHLKYRGCRLGYATDPCTLPFSHVN